MVMELSDLEHHLKEFVHNQDKLLEGRLKIWIMTAVIMQVLPLVAIAFFLGGIWQNLSTSMQTVQAQQTQMISIRQWMEARERWELNVEIWGAQAHPPLRIDKTPVK